MCRWDPSAEYSLRTFVTVGMYMTSLSNWKICNHSALWIRALATGRAISAVKSVTRTAMTSSSIKGAAIVTPPLPTLGPFQDPLTNPLGASLPSPVYPRDLDSTPQFPDGAYEETEEGPVHFGCGPRPSQG